MTAETPFHDGELALQRRYGVAERVGAVAARVVRDHLTEEHRAFYPLLPMIALGAADERGRPWASLIGGAPGFLRSPDPGRLVVGAHPAPGDPLAAALAPGLAVGGLGLQFETRRRNRFAARVEAVDPSGFTLAIDQTFGNCPQHIATRTPAAAPLTQPASAPEPLDGLDAAARATIAAADTFLVATAAPATGDPRRGADVSHRGGRPGFVRIEADGRLTVPDFAGNGHFNSLGNMLLNPRAGLSFFDGATGDVLMLTGAVAILFDDPAIAAFRGAERLWRFRMEAGVRLRGALPVRYALGEPSPFSLRTGDWTEAAAKAHAFMLP